MAALWALALALLAGVHSTFAYTRIVGGAPTSVDKYPSIVQVEFLSIFSEVWSQSCAANILTSRYVLSAAHCFSGPFYDPKYRRIRAGSTYRNLGGVIAYVEAELNHPTYGTLDADGDISVVRLSNALTYTPVVQRTSIIARGSIIPDNLPVVLAGWGYTSEDGSPSNVLLDTTVYTINNKLCAERYSELPNALVTENMICAGLLGVGGRDTCEGDSGGPLYYGNITIGIISWGEGCAQPNFPGVSTNIASYTDWIVASVN